MAFYFFARCQAAWRNFLGMRGPCGANPFLQCPRCLCHKGPVLWVFNGPVTGKLVSLLAVFAPTPKPLPWPVKVLNLPLPFAHLPQGQRQVDEGLYGFHTLAVLFGPRPVRMRDGLKRISHRAAWRIKSVRHARNLFAPRGIKSPGRFQNRFESFHPLPQVLFIYSALGDDHSQDCQAQRRIGSGSVGISFKSAISDVLVFRVDPMVIDGRLVFWPSSRKPGGAAGTRPRWRQTNEMQRDSKRSERGGEVQPPVHAKGKRSGSLPPRTCK